MPYPIFMKPHASKRSGVRTYVWLQSTEESMCTRQGVDIEQHTVMKWNYHRRLLFDGAGDGNNCARKARKSSHGSMQEVQPHK